MKIFIDTGAFYALADTSDKHHESAKAFYLSSYKPDIFVTSDYVVIESWTLLHHKLGQAAAKKIWQSMRMNIVRIERVSTLVFDHAWNIFEEYQDQDFSMVDCTSFALMERMQIEEAFAFDTHFLVFRTKTGTSFRIYPTATLA